MKPFHLTTAAGRRRAGGPRRDRKDHSFRRLEHPGVKAGEQAAGQPRVIEA